VNSNLVIAALMAPGSLSLPAIVAMWRHTSREAVAERAAVAAYHTTPPTTGPGIPAPQNVADAYTDHRTAQAADQAAMRLAEPVPNNVVPFRPRRAA
jgi:hypothetical protein